MSKHGWASIDRVQTSTTDVNITGLIDFFCLDVEGLPVEPAAFAALAAAFFLRLFAAGREVSEKKMAVFYRV